MHFLYKSLSFGLGASSLVRAYKWPNPLHDELDHYLFDQQGYNTGATVFQGGIPQCSHFFGADTFGRQNAAEWLRTAFHDAATHDSAAGTGGIDASIAVEADREENKGTAVSATLNFFFAFVTARVSLADLVALGVVAAMDSCGGPEIPFRSGRIDNFTPSPPGVPEPHQDIQTHINAFSRMGFTKEEMIGLVACGHSIGGVHHATFPDIVPPPPDPSTNFQGVQHFDSTFDSFDNKVATEFLAGTPNNPLAYGFNETTRSDFRIFTSDGNSTISRFAADNNVYKSTCGNLLEKMINTVPSGVTLSDVIKPVPVKPKIFLTLTSDGHLQVSGEVRFFNMEENPQRTVLFKWHNRRGGCADRTSRCSSTATHSANQVTTLFRGTKSMWYSFNATLDDSAGISDFWFEVDDHNGSSAKKMYAENGRPFPVDDRFFIIPNMSCQTQSQDDPSAQFFTTTFGLRATEKPSQVKLRTTRLSRDSPGLTYTRTEGEVDAILFPNSTSSNYKLYRASWTGRDISLDNFFFDAIATLRGGKQIVDADWSNRDFLDTPFGCNAQ
ncbi:heme peroxidase [Serendipita vermifera]|nr:heme peroxidase [Serendipita vermifera]